ncbi:NAD(P)H-binding protein [Microlunatus soli]|uniref:Uncharacterized conserved protein YbjT, contains NAD(P)-binding and DUF2867 domains n=1 Tax=Microlunatus soli TaxID=630515 RepID=A0A1H1P6S5_9ACTN|nr:NAD(P)H-binding protein [Microlunatus soli]SDS06978.1 Uncharacterized conserved protein YbjT, contains NAD(P)-binding and DUF2867 domains [Microlunatus soli]
MYLVSGATGNAGREVVRALLDQGAAVRALVRSADTPLPDGVERAVGDLDRPESVRPWLDGVDGIFGLPGYSGTATILAEADRAGVRRLVQLSGVSAGSGDRSNAITRYMIDSEDLARTCGLSWTIVRPSMFASNALSWRDQLRQGDVVTAAFGAVATAVIDPADIGAVVAAALTDDRHAGRTYRISGPEATRPADRVAVLGEVLGRDLRFVAQPDDVARREMAATMPKPYVDAFFDFYVDGSLDESPVLPTVAEITGRQPHSFRDWAVRNAGRFG